MTTIMTTIIAKRCSYCTKPRKCVTLVTTAGDGPSICIVCTTSAMRQFVARYQPRTTEPVDDR